MLAANIHSQLLHPDQSLLLVIDMQAGLLNVVPNADRLAARAALAMRGCRVLRLPVIASTQNAEKLGAMESGLARLLPPLHQPFDKMTFSCLGSDGIVSELQRSGRKQILIAGVEAHVCICQTALELLASGYQPHILLDAVGARHELDRTAGIEKMRSAGAVISSTEMALYELLRQAGNQEFREVLKLVKGSDAA